MTTIHLVRHGQAAAGFAGHADPGLSPTGVEQAERIADRLAKLNPQKLLSSPLARAQETAAPLAKRWQQAVTIETRVAEIPSPTTDLKARAAWLQEAMQGRWDDLGEALMQWRDGLATALREQREDCIIFSHYVAINAAVGVASDDLRLRIFAPDNCSVTTLRNDSDGLHVVQLGATADTFIN